MNIAALQPFSLSDYPGKTAAIVFTQGCNFRCSYCHNKKLIPLRNNSSVPTEATLNFFKKRKGKLQGVVVSGGEPTIQSGLISFIGNLIKDGFQVKLDTNGSKPEILEIMLKEKMLNYIALDIKAPPEKYAAVAGISVHHTTIQRSIQLILESGIEHEFRTTVAKNLLDAEDLLACGKLIKGDSNYFLQPVQGNGLSSNGTVESGPGNYTSEEFKHIINRMRDKGINCRLR